jgi:hypothetical protein
MALNIVIDEVTVVGFAKKRLGERGFELARPISAKNEQGQWETTGTNYFKIWIDPKLIAFDPENESQRVSVSGRLKISESEYEGKTRVELHLSATSAVVIPSREKAVYPESANPVIADVPF